MDSEPFLRLFSSPVSSLTNASSQAVSSQSDALHTHSASFSSVPDPPISPGGSDGSSENEEEDFDLLTDEDEDEERQQLPLRDSAAAELTVPTFEPQPGRPRGRWEFPSEAPGPVDEDDPFASESRP